MTALQRLATRYNLDPATARIVADGPDRYISGGSWRLDGTPTKPGAAPSIMLHPIRHGSTLESAAVEALAYRVRLALETMITARDEAAKYRADGNDEQAERAVATAQNASDMLRFLLGVE